MRFLTFPTWTVTYGSEVPLLSLAINPCADLTKPQINQTLVYSKLKKKKNTLQFLHKYE